MKNKFNIKDFMTANRESIIAQHEELTAEKFYNGISLRDFMIKILGYMAENCKSDKKATSYLPYAIANAYNASVKIGGSDFRTDALRAKHAGTSYMALV